MHVPRTQIHTRKKIKQKFLIEKAENKQHKKKRKILAYTQTDKNVCIIKKNYLETSSKKKNLNKKHFKLMQNNGIQVASEFEQKNAFI